ncbi:MAG: orotate phosphoribosyltransferase [Actinobacteria bacterium]|nr:orotate phosphoribosyltransferase [Actinomycetota bacterium]MBW3649728.1 orotate phosphoribosyltransferase [Actinomycetota bacterium]
MNDLAARIYAAAHLSGEFTLRSGGVSSEYFDKYRFEADPRLLRELADALALLVPAETEVLAGLELGGVPLATVVSQVTGHPLRLVRKQAKTYGTRQLAEGGDVHGLRICLVEDVITSGGAVIHAANALRDAGALVEAVVCVIDRQAGGREQLAALGLQVHALFTKSDLEAAADG